MSASRTTESGTASITGAGQPATPMRRRSCNGRATSSTRMRCWICARAASWQRSAARANTPRSILLLREGLSCSGSSHGSAVAKQRPTRRSWNTGARWRSMPPTRSPTAPWASCSTSAVTRRAPRRLSTSTFLWYPEPPIAPTSNNTWGARQNERDAEIPLGPDGDFDHLMRLRPPVGRCRRRVYPALQPVHAAAPARLEAPRGPGLAPHLPGGAFPAIPCRSRHRGGQTDREQHEEDARARNASAGSGRSHPEHHRVLAGNAGHAAPRERAGGARRTARFQAGLWLQG